MAKKLTTREKARRAWVRALRSKKYGWGKEKLHPSEGRYCCLGVLCEVAIKAGVIKGYSHFIGTLPPSVQDWAGVESIVGDFDDGSLIDMNDNSTRNPFLKIANLIERRPSGLFVD